MCKKLHLVERFLKKSAFDMDMRKVHLSHNKEGRRYGKLLVVERIVRNDIKRKNIWYRCACDCGKMLEINSERLKINKIKSCGCENLRRKIRKVKVGQKFGMLTTISSESRIVGEKKSSVVFWKCLCDCGNYHIARSNGLSYGETISCGCFRRRPELLNKNREESLIKKLYASNISNKNKMEHGRYSPLTLKQFAVLCKMNCSYCGCKPENEHKDIKRGKLITNHILYYSGMDKINPFGEYSIDNVLPCCSVCNRAKDNGTLEEFINHYKNILHYEQTSSS